MKSRLSFASTPKTDPQERNAHARQERERRWPPLPIRRSRRDFRRPPPVPPDTPAFLITKEHRRFTEFATAVRTNRHIGVCYGPPGVGKTLSARAYAGTTEWEQWQRTGQTNTEPIPPRVLEARTAFWTPTVTISPREIDRQLPRTCQRISWAVEYAQDGNIDVFEHRDSRASGLTELLIIDEADRLKPPALEQVRDYYDRHTMGVILIGMPGIEKRLARYPSSTAASASPTTIGPSAPRNSPSSWQTAGRSLA
ncbi:potential ATP-binding protein [Arthrobacter sp. Hiyo4]|nr:potential ATP-binding protein [Arthrobacter sp. Hiyo4]